MAAAATQMMMILDDNEDKQDHDIEDNNDDGEDGDEDEDDDENASTTDEQKEAVVSNMYLRFQSRISLDILRKVFQVCHWKTSVVILLISSSMGLVPLDDDDTTDVTQVCNT
jgi:hypothetical protein